MMIKLGDDHQVQAKKKGIVCLGGVDIETFFILEFRISLLSVGQLDSHGYTTTSDQGYAQLPMQKDKRILVPTLKMVCTHY